MAEVKCKRRAANVQDLTGQVFDRWTVISSAERKYGRSAWWCRCECGTERIVVESSLQRGISGSCGCRTREATAKRNRQNATHGLTGTPVYHAWRSMIKRCYRPNTKCYANYGGRGIKVCDRWMEFQNFADDMGPKPTPLHSLDREDNGGDYESGNCRWATPKMQMRNTRATRRVEWHDKMYVLPELAELYGLSRRRLGERLRAGWDMKRALTEPVGTFHGKAKVTT